MMPSPIITSTGILLFFLAIESLAFTILYKAVKRHSSSLLRINLNTRLSQGKHDANDAAPQCNNAPVSSVSNARERFGRKAMISVGALVAMQTLSGRSGFCAAAASAEEPTLTRADVGFINLNDTEPTVTDVCWMDIKIGDAEPQRIEISLYGG